MKKRIIKICAAFFISLIICLQFLVCASAYSEEYPDYLGIGNCAFVECNSNIGAGVVVLPIECRKDKVSLYQTNLQNVSDGYISGKFVTYDGTSTDIRAQSLGNFQYTIRTGYNTEYQDLVITTVTNTNINFSLAEDTKENTVAVINDFEKTLLTCVLLNMIITALTSLFIVLSRSKKI